MSKRKRRSFTPEFKAEAVALVRTSGKTVHQVAKDLDLTETALREWVSRSKQGVPLVGKPEVTPGERAELEALRKEVRVLKMERDFLKRAAAFFAKENG